MQLTTCATIPWCRPGSPTSFSGQSAGRSTFLQDDGQLNTVHGTVKLEGNVTHYLVAGRWNINWKPSNTVATMRKLTSRVYDWTKMSDLRQGGLALTEISKPSKLVISPGSNGVLGLRGRPCHPLPAPAPQAVHLL